MGERAMTDTAVVLPSDPAAGAGTLASRCRRRPSGVSAERSRGRSEASTLAGVDASDANRKLPFPFSRGGRDPTRHPAVPRPRREPAVARPSTRGPRGRRTTSARPDALPEEVAIALWLERDLDPDL